ncbi:MAG: hypothetical protein VB095_00770 [Anaerovorax sp.]|nr:hypothetical protein [Anaerovorax sp.]
MLSVKSVKNSFWRVPLITLIAGWLYSKCYFRIALRFGVTEPGVIDDKISLLASGFLLMVTLILGWAILLRKQTRIEIFVSSSIVVVYSLLLWAIQLLTNSTTGSAAVVFMHLATPLEWMTFPSLLGIYLQEHSAITIPLIGYLHFFVPWLFIIFGRKNTTETLGL